MRRGSLKNKIQKSRKSGGTLEQSEHCNEIKDLAGTVQRTLRTNRNKTKLSFGQT